MYAGLSDSRQLQCFAKFLNEWLGRWDTHHSAVSTWRVEGYHNELSLQVPKGILFEHIYPVATLVVELLHQENASREILSETALRNNRQNASHNKTKTRYRTLAPRTYQVLKHAIARLSPQLREYFGPSLIKGDLILHPLRETPH